MKKLVIFSCLAFVMISVIGLMAFRNRSRTFAGTYGIYAYCPSSGTYSYLITGALTGDLTTIVGGMQATITNTVGTACPLYAYSVTTGYLKLYFTGCE